MKLPRHCAVVALFACVLLNTGCAVVMAVKGKEDPNLGVLGVGQDRAIAISTLGSPSKTYDAAGNSVDVFKLKRGDKPSATRAIVHGVLDFMTLCLWEVVGTPIEATQGETFYVTVYYNEEDRIVKMLPGDDGSEIASSRGGTSQHTSTAVKNQSAASGSVVR